MKKSELQQIIKEEIKRVVKENMQKAVQPDFESYYAAKRAGKILPGYYNAVESNYGGTYDIPQFTIRFTQEMTFEDAYKQLNNKALLTILVVRGLDLASYAYYFLAKNG